jgi:Plasmid pRiA4b ORF-3-like protein
MPDERVDSTEATSLVGWLLEGGVAGLGLTKTHSLQRVLVREAAERWPQWWNHDLFGPPSREAELPVLEVTHAALRDMRLLRRQRETLRTTAQGRALLADPDALLEALHDDLSLGGDFQASAWRSIESVLHEYGPLTDDQLAEIVASLLRNEGWSEAGGDPIDPATLRGELQPLLWLAEGYGLLRRSPRGALLTLELTPVGHRSAAGPGPASTPAAPGDSALVFDAVLLNARGVRARLAVLERQPLTALHDGIQQAFGWWDDHLYSFWLDGSFFGDDKAELTTPDHPDAGVATADVPLAELGLSVGQRIGYVFDFGDDWRVRLTVRERVVAEALDHPRVLELRGTPPPQYAAIDD